MNVYLFKIDKEKAGAYGTGLVLVAANDPFEAWDALEKELPVYDACNFSPQKCELIHSLTSLLTEPAVITYCCYVE